MQPATPKDVKRLIEQLPTAGLPEILTCVVKMCIQRKVFGDRKVAAITETLEAKLRGTIKKGT